MSTQHLPASEPIITRFCDIKPISQPWLWPGRIPLGAVVVLAGEDLPAKLRKRYEANGADLNKTGLLEGKRLETREGVAETTLTLRRAKMKLGVLLSRTGYQAGFVWRLSQQPKTPKARQNCGPASPGTS